MLRRRAHDPANARRPFRLSTSDTILVIIVLKLKRFTYGIDDVVGDKHQRMSLLC